MAIGKVNAVEPSVNETVASVRIQYHKKLTAEREKSEALLAQQSTYLDRIKELESEVNRYRNSSKSKDAPQFKNVIDTKNVERLATEMSEFRNQYKQEQNDLQKEISSLREQNSGLESRLGKAERALRESKNTRQAPEALRVPEKKDLVEKTKQTSKSVQPERQSKASKAIKTAAGENGPQMKESPSVPTGFSSDEMRKVFKRFDYNGNGILSLAEIDKALIEGYPHLSAHKPAIMRAYKAADSSEDGFIQFREFHQLMDYLYVYDAYFIKFQAMDENNDRRLTLEEFKEGYTTAFGTAAVDLETVFRSIDKNGGGYILFDEFCLYLADEAQKRNIGANS